jgi:threonine aldolase
MTTVPLHDPTRRGFAGDNHAGVHPEVLVAIARANGGHQPSYGGDVHTERLRRTVRGHFGPAADVHPVLNGTGANVVALQAMLDVCQAVICAESAHINVDECGAPERVGGIKLLPVPTPDGKLTPELVAHRTADLGNRHRAQPRVVSLTQCTETGLCYTADEIRALCERAHGLGLLVHMDGARIANAAAHLGVSLYDMTTGAGVDVLSFGGSKNGLLLGDAVIVLEPRAVRSLGLIQKSVMQLASKTRFISAQLDTLLDGDLWLRSAARANAMADRLHRAVRGLPGLTVTRPVQTNHVFAVLPPDVTRRLLKRFPFHVWNERTGEVRWVTAFDTTEEDVDTFAAAIGEELKTS